MDNHATRALANETDKQKKIRSNLDLSDLVNSVPKHNILVLCGDFNTKVGCCSAP